ncbi:NYN domain-containing protein [Streptomyces hawaiiensis]|uniref:NYN domain-containing protein n=1 Tax=Streptomyces hawaiiensis TaxID=67305 RepID=UPI003649CB54
MERSAAQAVDPAYSAFRLHHRKNATDAALVIDAMDLLYTDRFDGFCIVSSDSDFTRLATRIRESGLTIYGFGEWKTPKPFVSSCDKFIYTENLAYTPSSPQLVGAAPRSAVQTGAGGLRDAGLMDLLHSVVEGASNDDQRVYQIHLSAASSYRTQLSEFM